MNTSDQQLLQQYRDGSEAAFAELVRRHAGWIHGMAQRRTGDASLADDITQATFIVLVRKAKGIRPDVILPAWLFRVAHFATCQAQRKERRRAAHEAEAAMQHPSESASASSDWELLAPLLDELLTRLGRRDRSAVLLRFYEQLSYAEVGDTLGIGEEAARKRISRALEKLRSIASRRNLTISAPAIGALIEVNTACAASPQLVSAVLSAAAGSSAGIATTASASLVEGVILAMKFAQMKLAGLVVFAVIVATGAGTMLAIALTSQPTHRLQFRLVDDAAGQDPVDVLREPLTQNELRVQKEVLLDESAIASARVHRGDSGWELMMTLHPDAGEKLGQITETNINGRLAFVFDGKLLSAPVIRTKVTSNVMISMPDETTARELAAAIGAAAPAATQPASQPAVPG